MEGSARPTLRLPVPPDPSGRHQSQPARKIDRIHLTASSSPEAQKALAALSRRYRSVPIDEADVIVALGGDGFILATAHRLLGTGLAIYGMNRGTIGFLMNAYEEDGLMERLERSVATPLRPLAMKATKVDGVQERALAINEVSLLRETRQAAKIRISVDGVERLPELISDGVMVATPAGSTAYNLSAFGPILPIGCRLLALTPVSAFRPRRWRGAVLPASARIRFDILEANKRPVSAVADFTEIREVASVDIWEDDTVEAVVLFDPQHNLEERILREQFSS